MSLEHLINIVGNELQLSKEFVLDKLELLLSVGQKGTFSKQTLKDSGLLEKEINLFIENLLSAKLMSKSYSYECQSYADYEITNDITSNCEFCEKTIQDSPSHIILELFELEEELMNMVNMEQEEILKNYLQEEYIDNYNLLSDKINKIVPFLGSGVSIPLGLPDWGGLIWKMKEKLPKQDDQDYFETLMNKGDFLGALDLVLECSPILNTENRIKEYVSKRIRDDFNGDVDDFLHNIKDILNLNSDFVITTNYDNALSYYKKGYGTAKTTDDIEDLQELFDEKQQQIIHFHGMADRRKTMIVTRQDYDEFYDNQKTKDILNGIMAGKSLIFIGFSFQDFYFQELYTRIRTNIGGEHFIILPNLHPRENKQLSAKGLRPIGIKVAKEGNRLSKQGYVDALKCILNRLI
ncbi:SIR2 family NAD-dependent protein deacylase [Bacillus thuringiensis]|uniref:SIR2 family NAD-dependent protein deacylase n=1 Tax=Bacillus thuringiensis TaxID=1428 RepID=UPI0037F84AE4|nr:SIR2 family protein [Bacillus cereus]MCU5270664.1 SIR2 family protein [Bacillus cereus]